MQHKISRQGFDAIFFECQKYSINGYEPQCIIRIHYFEDGKIIDVDERVFSHNENEKAWDFFKNNAYKGVTILDVMGGIYYDFIGE